jgi:glycosyl transferase family 2
MTLSGPHIKRAAGIKLVTGTRLAEPDFWKEAPLAHSLHRLADPRLNTAISFSNTEPLPVIYNRAIELRDEADVLVFMHDDIWIDDYYFTERILSGLSQFDVIGLAGTRKRRPGQRAWSFVTDPAVRDDPQFLSGRIAQGDHPWGRIWYWGPVPTQCELLDGVLLATRAAVLRDRGVRFDPQFPFHFYDMDFCRTATQSGLRLGTWPICVTHRANADSFASVSWNECCGKYLAKWPD